MVTKTTKPSKRFHIMLSWDTWQELVAFVEKRYGRNRGLSLTVERAVREFLARQEA